MYPTLWHNLQRLSLDPNESFALVLNQQYLLHLSLSSQATEITFGKWLYNVGSFIYQSSPLSFPTEFLSVYFPGMQFSFSPCVQLPSVVEGSCSDAPFSSAAGKYSALCSLQLCMRNYRAKTLKSY